MGETPAPTYKELFVLREFVDPELIFLPQKLDHPRGHPVDYRFEAIVAIPERTANALKGRQDKGTTSRRSYGITVHNMGGKRLWSITTFSLKFGIESAF
ncbi:MAG: hypothetical protein ACLQVJ_07450 [Syntrophobacteraceae bacterium]